MSYTTAAELRDVRKAIRELLRGAKSASISSPMGTQSYTSLDLPVLRDHAKYLYGLLSRANIRKRTAPDFS